MEIVVGIDGSQASHRALEVALQDAARSNAHLTVHHSWQPNPLIPPGFGCEVAALALEDRALMAKHYVEELLSTVPHAGLRLATDIRAGDPGRDLVEASRGASLLVLGSRRHGALASAVVGSATNYVLHHATCPVLVVPAEARLEWARVVVGVDGSECADVALRWAAHRARAHQVPLVVVHAWELVTAPDWFGGLLPDPVAYGEQVEGWLAEHVDEALPDQEGLAIELRAVQDSTAGALTGTSQPDDLLVVGSHGRSGFTDLVMGSVAAHCAHHARGAVAVLRRGSVL
jgi:nucleotide-binding universal stress UspA family protein